MRTLRCSLLLVIVSLASAVSAQRDFEACSSPALDFGGDGGPPASITDTVNVSQSIVLDELHVTVDIAHTWVADLLVDLTSPAGTTLRLHDGLGGNADDLRVIFADGGVANGALGYNFGCYMQPSNGSLGIFDGENSSGPWSLDITDDFPTSDNGVLESWCLEGFTSPTAVLSSVESLACLPTSDGANLTWSNPQPFGAIELVVNGVVTNLPGSATSHTLTGYAPGTSLNITLEGSSATGVSCPVSCSVLTLSGGSTTQVAIVIDEEYDDWVGVPITFDPTGDTGSGSLDLRSLSVADDDESLFIRFAFLDPEIPLDEGDSCILYIDTDANAATGTPIQGIGADLVWNFGARGGTLESGGGSTAIDQGDIGLIFAPTVSATEYEVRIRRNSPGITLGSQVSIVLCDDSPGGDCLPDTGSVAHTLGFGQLPPDIENPIDRAFPTDIRFVSYNVLSNNPFQSEGATIGRQIAAVAADVYCFQEIGAHSVAETIAYVDSWTSPPGGGSWFGGGNSDCKVVSRFPVLQQWNLSGNVALWLDTTAVWGSPSMVINAHPPCCANDSGRQNECDQIAAFIRDQRQSGRLQVHPNAPVLILGDMNFVGLSQQRTTLLTGEIIDQGQWGVSAAPDADGTSLTDVRPLHVATRHTYTWRQDSSSFAPGYLDYIIYSDAVLDEGRSFVLRTQDLSTATLIQHGLQANDSDGSDHLLVAADFRLPSVGDQFLRGDCNDDGALDISDAIRLLTALFSGGAAPNCESACDANDDGGVNIADAIALLDALFTAGPSIPAPSGACGIDPTPDGLSCGSSNCP